MSHLHRLAFGRPILGDAARMFDHGGIGRHAIKLLVLFTVALHSGAGGLLGACEHAAHHDKVGAAAKGLGRIARARDATVSTDKAAEAVSRVGAFDDRRELRIAHTGLLAGGAHAAGPNAHLDNVGLVRQRKRVERGDAKATRR